MAEKTNNFNIKIESNTTSKLVFSIDGASVPFVNALRRVLISEIPAVAIDGVTFTHNTSILQDELLAHKLSFIPIKSNEDNSVFELNVHATKEMIVYSGDLKSKDASVAVRDIEIIKLKAGQSITAKCECKRDIAKNHAKFGVCHAYYKMKPKIEISKGLTKDESKKIVEVCPMKVFDIEDGKLLAKHGGRCSMCGECANLYQPQKVNVSLEHDQFLFTIESNGTRKPYDLLVTAIEILKNKIETIKKNIKK